MAEVKDKIVTVESLSALHQHNKDTYMQMVNPTGSGTMTFDGDISADSIATNSVAVSGDSEISGASKTNNLTVVEDADVGRYLTVSGGIIGDLSINGNVVIKNIDEGLYGVHPTTGKWYNMVHMNPYGNTVIGYSGYENGDSSSLIYGKDVEHYIASAGNTHYRPYYRAGDTINVNVRTSGYVTQLGTNVFFTIPLTKPIIGEPTIEITSEKGFILRQDGKYTHGSDGSTTPATYTKPIKYSVDNNFNSGINVIAEFENITNVVNNDSIGIYLDAKIKFL